MEVSATSPFDATWWEESNWSLSWVNRRSLGYSSERIGNTTKTRYGEWRNWSNSVWWVEFCNQDSQPFILPINMILGKGVHFEFADNDWDPAEDLKMILLSEIESGVLSF